jgi:hypothetical protein
MTYANMNAQNLDLKKIKSYEHQLDDVMEVTDASVVKTKLLETELAFQKNPNELNKVRLGIIYHETTLNLSFLSKGEFKGYAKKSYDILNELYTSPVTTNELLPFIASYRASALSLMSSETKKLKFLGDAFKEFQIAINRYAEVSYCPEFMRGSVSENLPWLFFSKRKYAKHDFQSIITKQEKDNGFANWKTMSFTYWAWAKQHQSKKYRKQALAYLDKAIQLDPNYQAGRKRAEELKKKLTKA